MNIIFIICDTLRADYLGCYGNKWVRTPYLDKFAAEAALFEKCYAGSFPTIPNRADILSGRYVFHAQGWAPLPPTWITFPQLLLRKGYVNQLISDHDGQLLAPGMNLHKGFNCQWLQIYGSLDPLPVELPCAREKMREPVERLTVPYLRRHRYYIHHEADYQIAQLMQEAMNWLDRNYTQEKFLLYIDSLCYVHEPWVPPKWLEEMYDPGYEGERVISPRYDKCDYLTEAELKHVKAMYAAEITLMDKWIGLLLQKVKELGLWDDTAIFFTSDHGWYFGEHGYIGKQTILNPMEGWPLYEEVAHIPLIAWIPGISNGQRSNFLNQPVDLMPTILELAEAQVPKVIQGRSLLPALRGKEKQCRDFAVTSAYSLPTNPKSRVYSSVTDGEWNLQFAGARAKPELYYLPSDPQQQKDLFEEDIDVAKELHDKYYELLKELETSEERLVLRKWTY